MTFIKQRRPYISRVSPPHLPHISQVGMTFMKQMHGMVAEQRHSHPNPSPWPWPFTLALALHPDPNPSP